MRDLDKVNELETKVKTEIQALKQRVVDLNEAVKKFANIDQLKKEAEAAKKVVHVIRRAINSLTFPIESGLWQRLPQTPAGHPQAASP